MGLVLSIVVAIIIILVATLVFVPQSRQLLLSLVKAEEKEVHCPHRKEGCQWKGKHGSLRNHLNSDDGCDFERVKCDGCNEIFKRKDYLLHAIHDKVDCPNLSLLGRILGKWSPSSGCEWNGSCTKLRQHLNEQPTEKTWLEGCDFVKVKCIYCQDQFQRHQLKKKAQNLEAVLSQNDLRLLLVKTWDARIKWYNIGSELGTDPSTLESIQHDQRDNCDKCYREILLHWLRSNKRKTWKVVVDALKCCAVGYEQLSEEVKKCKYIYQCD